MLVTLLGIVIEVRLEQNPKALSGIVAVQPNSILYPPPIGPAVFKLGQPLKTVSPILVTLLGIVTDVREEQPLKALLTILVTLLGIVTDVREEQPLKV